MPKYRGEMIKYVYIEAENEDAAFDILMDMDTKNEFGSFGIEEMDDEE